MQQNTEELQQVAYKSKSSLVICSHLQSENNRDLPRLAFVPRQSDFNAASASPDGDDLPKVQLVIVHLGDEDGRHGLVERGAVHVDRGTDGQHEADDAPVDVVVLQQALEGDRQRGRTGEASVHILRHQPDREHPGRPPAPAEPGRRHMLHLSSQLRLGFFFQQCTFVQGNTSSRKSIVVRGNNTRNNKMRLQYMNT